MMCWSLPPGHKSAGEWRVAALHLQRLFCRGHGFTGCMWVDGIVWSRSSYGRLDCPQNWPDKKPKNWKHGLCRYMLAEDETTVYVAFIGTKQRRDLVTNAAVLQVLLWPDTDSDSSVSLPSPFFPTKITVTLIKSKRPSISILLREGGRSFTTCFCQYLESPNNQ